MKGIARAVGRREGAGSRNRQRILLVEDSRMFTVALSRRISDETKAEVHCCSSIGELTVALGATDAHFDVIVADLNLSDSPRVQVLDVVAATGIPTIVFTGNFALERSSVPDGANIVDYILKDSPDIFEDVVFSVQRLLSNNEMRILVAASSQPVLSRVSQLLKARRFLVTEAETGKAALERLNEFPDIGIVFADHALSDMTGQMLVRKIRRDYDMQRLRIIGSGPSDDMAANAAGFRRAGVDEFIAQPFHDDDFHQRVAGNADTLTHFRKLQAIASRDFLTDMFNRRHFFERGPVIVRQALEQDEPVCAAVMDIDHFKKFNDTYGHETGDVVLKAVARKIREIVGDTFHLSARLGGEEFAMLFRGMNLEDATVFCDRLREDVAATRIVSEEEELSVTISIGLAEITEIETFDNYLHAADQYLYMAKNSGRNRVFSDYSIVQLFADRKN